MRTHPTSYRMSLVEHVSHDLSVIWYFIPRDFQI